MCTSPSSPPQTPVTTVDEHHTSSVKSTLVSPEHATQSYPDSPPSSSQSPAPPVPSPPHAPVNTMSAIQKIQPNSPSKNLTTPSISVDSCSIPPDSVASSQRDQHVKVLSQPVDSGFLASDSLPMKSRQSITPSFSFPGASSAATAYDCILSSVDSHCTLTTTSSTQSISATSPPTPNVYVNGLPPHFSEQEFFALTRPFGDIKSVRTFTRHVSEKPTGYGFVLFHDIESAQRCIEGLRKCRNLHPSFSKQVHRIPGTEYAQQNCVQSTDQDEHSFKARMEKLKDDSSTNLYIEGLPLSVDEESLSALMRPHKIKSSRFFKTKLSNPPRIIAFVRLETRVAAEETIDRLHGRMVRGWDDPGCRISVRFADSAEQRELRRSERTLKNGDQSPSRLTIAQAALLNLRGKDFQTNIRDVAGGKPQRLANSRLDTFNPGSDSGLLPASRSLPSKLRYPYGESRLLSTSDLQGTPDMDSLLQSIQNMGYEDGALDNSVRSLALENEYLMARQAQLRALASAALVSPNPPPMALSRGHTQARNGFTPAEELILEAHAHGPQLQEHLTRPPPFEPLRKSNVNVQNFDSTPYESFHVPGPAGKPMFPQYTLPTISEDHASRSFTSTPSHEYLGRVDGCPPAGTIFVRPPSRAVSIVPPPPDYEEPGRRPKSHQRVERTIGSKPTSCPSSSLKSGEGNPHSSLLQAHARPNGIGNGNGNQGNISTIPCDIELQHTYMYSHGDTRSCPDDEKCARFRSLPASHNYAKKSPKLQHSMNKEGPRSPAVVSPALTYSSRTPSTLSPATPFFGTFTGSQDAFEVLTMDNEDMAERRLKARMANK